jgi:hypothetical protein
MTNTFYIGTRADWSEMNNAVNHSVSRLNEKMSKTLRDIALQKGIKKTEQGAKLLFYSVSQDELDTLMANPSVRPLLKVNQDQMSNSLNKVNSSYPRRMDTNLFAKYQAELNKAMFDCVEVIGTDKNEPSQRQKHSWSNPYKVGDWVDTSNQYSYRGTGITKALSVARKEHFGQNRVLLSDCARVYRVSDKSYWIEVPVIKHTPEGASNYDWAKAYFPNVILEKGNPDFKYQQDWDWTIPYEGNEDAFYFIQCKTPIRVSEFESEYPSKVKHGGYRSEHTQRD